MKIYLNSQPEPIMNVPIKLADVLNLDNGSAFVGICQETHFTHNVLEVSTWSFMSSSSTFSLDKWNGLSLEYKTHWPLHLFLPPEILD